MKAFLARLIWKFRSRRNVRVQLVSTKGSGSVDGILVGVVAGHYRLRNSFFYENKPDAIPVEMVGETWIPRENVILLNVKVS